MSFLREHLPFDHGVPGDRWLTILMNRIPPALFAAAFTDWVRETWPETPDLVAIDGKTSRRSHDRKADKPLLHLVCAFATTAKLVLGQEAVASRSNETTAIPVLIERLAVDDGLKGALVSIDAIATNARIAGTIRNAGADYLLAVKANQPTLRAETEALFADVPAAELDEHHDLGKGHGRIEDRRTTVCREVGWLAGDRRFPGEVRLPDIASIIRVVTRTQIRDRCRFETRYYISSAPLTAERAAMPYAATGPSRTPSTGYSMSPSRRINPDCEKGMGTEHGHRPTLRPQPHPQPTRQTVPQTPQKTSRVGHRIPQRRSQIRTSLTSMQGPGVTRR